MPLIRQRVKLKLDRLSLRQKRHPHHAFAGRLRKVHNFSTLRLRHNRLFQSLSGRSLTSIERTVLYSLHPTPYSLFISAFANGCGAVGPSPIVSPAASIVFPCTAPERALSIINSANRRV